MFSVFSWPTVFVFFFGTCIDQLKDFIANETCETYEKRQFLFKTFRVPGGQTLFRVFRWPPAFSVGACIDPMLGKGHGHVPCASPG
jgi:hypothetical protein